MVQLNRGWDDRSRVTHQNDADDSNDPPDQDGMLRACRFSFGALCADPPAGVRDVVDQVYQTRSARHNERLLI
ncbi:hypothetical protein ACP0FP_26080, partial [Escherichia coli]